MNFRPGTQWERDLLPSIAPIFRIDLNKKIACLIGTGFWISQQGHLVTAKHVIQDNIDGKGNDKGPIFAVQTRSDRSIICRGLSSSDIHPLFDLALAETYIPGGVSEQTQPLPISLDFLDVKDAVCSFAVFSYDQIYENPAEGFTYIKFTGSLCTEYVNNVLTIQFAIGFSFGEVEAIFEEKRDSVMLPFPCIETSVRIYGGNSGGPLINSCGRVCGIHCSSYDRQNISYHVPSHGLLSLRVTTKSLGIEDGYSKFRSLMELALNQKLDCSPPLLDESRMLRSCLLWIQYALKCKFNNETISEDIIFGQSKSNSDPNFFHKYTSTISLSVLKLMIRILR